MGRGEQEGDAGEEDGVERPQAAGEERVKQGEGEGHGGGRERHHARPAGDRLGAGIEDLRQPLLGDPRAPGEGEGERVGGGEGAMGDDPAADDDVPVAVGVVEQAVADSEHDEIEHAADGERHERRRGSAAVAVVPASGRCSPVSSDIAAIAGSLGVFARTLPGEG